MADTYRNKKITRVNVENDSIAITDNSGSITVDGAVSVSNFPATYPSAAASAYTLGYTGSLLTTITRTSDSKTITLGWTGSNLTSISDWA